MALHRTLSRFARISFAYALLLYFTMVSINTADVQLVPHASVKSFAESINVVWYLDDIGFDADDADASDSSTSQEVQKQVGPCIVRQPTIVWLFTGSRVVVRCSKDGAPYHIPLEVGTPPPEVIPTV